MPIQEIFGIDGLLTNHIPNYIPRPGQVAMAEAIHSHIRAGTHLLVEGPTGCHAEGQEILMYDGTIKTVEDIRVGDSLMGPDSQVRKVLELCKGRERMVHITPKKGDQWTVNQNHILTLVRTETRKQVEGGRRKDYKGNTSVDVRVTDYEDWSATHKHIHKLFRVGVVFDPPSRPTSLDPYFLGVYLGDGSTATGSVGVCTMDHEVVAYLEDFSSQFGLGLRVDTPSRNAPNYYIRDEHHSGSKRNPVLGELRELGLFKKVREGKFIPHHYKTSSIENRLELLAGLIDSDGHLTCNCYEISSRSPTLAKDILFLARSLGFSAYSSKRAIDDKEYDRISISGEVQRIPCRIGRKKAQKRKQKKDPLRTGFKIEEAGEGDYYGFSLTGDGRFLLGDFTVTHNTGKSMAYGIPAALRALEVGDTVVIVTANIPLQEQLIKKDLPLIADALEGALTDELGEPYQRLTYRLMKGFSNYLCRRELAAVADSPGPPKWLDVIEDWEAVSDSGDKSDVPSKLLAQSLQDETMDSVWRDVSTNSDDCTRKECNFYDKCYVFKARRGCANVIVTNYHMLYQDFMVREMTGGDGIFPQYSVIIMDEAHEAVDIAMDFHGFDLTERKVGWSLRGLRRLKSEAADRTIRTILGSSEAFFEDLKITKNHLDAGILEKPLGPDFGLIAGMRHGYRLIKDTAKNVDNREHKALLLRQARALWNTSYQIETVCMGIADDKGMSPLPTGNVYFITEDGFPNPTVHLKCKTVEVQGFLRKNIFEDKVMIATSATLTTNDNFNFIAKEFGLSPAEHGAMIAPSPFDSDRVLFVTPEEVPEPMYSNRDAHMEAVAMAIASVAADLGGRTLGLFTTHKALKHAAAVVRRQLPNMNVLVQGEMYDRTALVNEFKKDGGSVLLGTSSFWQGVDVPGPALSCLVIDKIPFTPPNDPVMRFMEKKFEASTGSGRAAFTRYSVPKAVIRLKQGMGRLIRTEEDYGVLILCDRRFLSKGYRDTILSAVPNNCWDSQTLGSINKFMRRF